MLSNPTGGSRWIVQSRPARPITGNKAWDWTIHRLPPVGLRRIFRVLGSLGLNNPPAAAGGILMNITCVETLDGPLCATVAETIFAFHYVLIRGFRLDSLRYAFCDPDFF